MSQNAGPEKSAGGSTEPEASFEKTLSELEDIVAQLEAGAKPLDESLALYEQGVSAYRRCNSILEKAKSRIRQVVASANGDPVFREAEMPKPQNPPAQPVQKSSRRTSSPLAKRSEDAAPAPSNDVKPPAPEASEQSKAGDSLFGNT